MVYIIFGVSGIGKTSIGKKISVSLGIPFYDADDFHSKANILKMGKGQPLNDEDRKSWLEELQQNIEVWNRSTGAVLACSALKESYRKILKPNKKPIIKWVLLYADIDTITKRLQKRTNHFFDVNLLQSQFDTLEIPTYGLHINANQSQENIVMQILKDKIKKTSFGVIGLGVMGKSLALNIASKGTSLSVYNRHIKGKEVNIAKKFVNKFNKNSILGFDNIELFVNSLEKPRNILLMVNAGKPVDDVINELIPFLDADDVIIDGGNSHFNNTKRRISELKNRGIYFIGMGVSGGEEGALKGPSLMPSGSLTAYKRIATVLEGVSAKDSHGNYCCTYVGPEGSGHFIKMIHNGIEYGEMQIISEIYHFLRFHAGKTPVEIATIFESWNQNKFNSYLLEITIAILRKKENTVFLIDKILDQASQKGTGGWSTSAALDLGKPLNTIAESVMARYLSAMKPLRSKASKLYKVEKEQIEVDLSKLKNAYIMSRIVNHAIGFDVIQEASIQYEWNLNLSEIARIWTNGCIIRSGLMEDIVALFKNSNEHLLVHKTIVKYVSVNIPDYTEVISTALNAKCSIPVMSSGLNYLLGFVSEQSSANMIQAQRDYFGAHTYQRIDKPLSEYFHTKWSD